MAGAQTLSAPIDMNKLGRIYNERILVNFLNYIPISNVIQTEQAVIKITYVCMHTYVYVSTTAVKKKS